MKLTPWMPFVFAVMLLTGQDLRAQGTDTVEADSVVVSLPETVELALVVASITELGVRDGGSVNRSTPYYQEVEAHFASFRTHSAVTALGSGFSLPRLVGNAANYRFGPGGELLLVDTSGSLWGDADGDLFARHRTDLEAFSRLSGFREFYAAHRPLYDELIKTTKGAAGVAAQQAWLEANFAARPGAPQVFVSPLMAGHHWTTLHNPKLRIWTSPPASEDDGVLGRTRFARKVFTELSHAYVNPETSRLLVDVRRAMGDGSVWGESGSAENYRTAELRFNEYMTWAAFLLFASEHIESGAFGTLCGEVIQFMEERRGFVAFGAFAQEALARFKAGASGAQVQREMTTWSVGYEVGRRQAHW